MWEIYEHNRISKIIKKLPEEILKRYENGKMLSVYPVLRA
jgi:hypothetical protein